jgi:hypothetical protein
MSNIEDQGNDHSKLNQMDFPSSTTMQIHLLSLPNEVLETIFTHFTTFELLLLFQHIPPCKQFGLWQNISNYEIDLENDITTNLLTNNNNSGAATIQESAGATPAAATAAVVLPRLNIKSILSQKHRDYIQLIRFIHSNTRDTNPGTQ